MTQRIYAAQATVIRNLNEKGPCVIAVSYTHLDVYKRQGLGQDNVNHGLGISQAETAPGFKLSFVNGHNTCLLYTSRCV